MNNLPLNIDYSGKVVVVTGAGGLICGAMAMAFAQSGAKVAALDLNEDAVKKLADEAKAAGYIMEGYKANVLEPEALEAVHQAVLNDLGPCDILVNGAGGNNPRATTDNEYQHEAKEGGKSFFDLEPNGVDFVFKLNFQGSQFQNIGLVAYTGITLSGQLSSQLLNGFLVQVQSRNLSTGLSIGAGHIAAQNATGTGDDDDLTGKIAIQGKIHSKLPPIMIHFHKWSFVIRHIIDDFSSLRNSEMTRFHKKAPYFHETGCQ